MSAPAQIRVRDEDGVRVVTLARPEKKNAIGTTLATELTAALVGADASDEVRVTVVEAEGTTFCAGVDVNVFLQLGAGDSTGVAPIAALGEALIAAKKPIIACVHAAAVGMGVTLLPHFDMVYAGEGATFTTPFVRLGLVLEYGSSYTLPRLIGRQRANELVYRASPLDAVTAAEWGLVTRVFPDDALRESTLAIAREVASHPSSAVVECKRLLREGETSLLDAAFARENEALSKRYGSPENVAAVQAFLGRRR